jgi:hypothetical protein
MGKLVEDRQGLPPHGPAGRRIGGAEMGLAETDEDLGSLQRLPSPRYPSRAW